MKMENGDDDDSTRKDDAERWKVNMKRNMNRKVKLNMNME